MIRKIVNYIRYRVKLKELDNYLSVYAIYKGKQLCDPVTIYKKGAKILEESYPHPERYLKRSVIEGIDAAIAGTSAIDVFYLDKNDKMKDFIKVLYRSRLNGEPELILDF